MKSITRNVMILAGVAAIALVLAPAAEANCIPGKVFSSLGAPPNYGYVDFSSGTNANVTARFWQDGNRAAGNEGTYDDAAWLRPVGDGRYYISGDLGDAAVAGCISTRMLMLLQNNLGTSSEFVLMSVAEGTGAAAYDFTTIGLEYTGVPIPRPRVISSTRSGTAINLQVQVDSAAAGAYGDGAAAEITYNVLQATGTTDPGRTATTYTTLASGVPAGTPTSVSVDCSNTATDRFIVTQLVIDGGQVSSDLVSAPTRVECDSNLADPNFKLIDRKPTTVKPRRDR